MPPRTRAVRAPKASKENVDLLVQTKVKNTGKGTKPVRKPLADKTNSASDENASPESHKKNNKQTVKQPVKAASGVADVGRPRRNRRLPPRYVENQVLKNLSNSKENAVTPNKSLNKTPDNDSAETKSSFKTPNNVLDKSYSLIPNRPKRVSRLPSKFDENLSPNKFIPTQCHTSTPLVSKVQDKPKTGTPLKPKDSKRTSGRLAELATHESALISHITSKVQTPQKKTSTKSTTLKSTPSKQILTRGASDKVACQSSTPLELEVPDKPQHAKRTLTGKQKVSTQKSSKIVTPEKNARVSPRKGAPKTGTPLKAAPLKISPSKNEVTQKKLVQKKISEVFENNVKTEINRKDRAKRLRKPVKYRDDTLSPRIKNPEKDELKNSEGRKILKANSSFRVLEEKKSKVDNQDIYEFTFDPSEEPPPQKKKRKKVTVKKSSKPKTRVYNNNYEKNIAKALADLKNVVSKQTADDDVNAPKLVPSSNKVVDPVAKHGAAAAPNPSSVVISTVAEIHPDPAQNTSTRSNVSAKNHASIRVEDIAADFDASIEHDINYSPVNSPQRDTEPDLCPRTMTPERTIRHDDPLNLRNDLSFFDDQPVANSSMNVSARNPMATPWRVEFENLPIKWQANTYVKPDMTPALESSYIHNFDDSKKKHVYTNLVAQSNDALPEIEENEAPRLKQTSIISFIKEVVERSATKKKRGVSVTPTKANSLFDATPGKTPRTEVTPRKDTDKSTEIDSEKSLKRKNNNDNNPTPAKLPRKDNENTLFGFDDSENQENISPVKNVNVNRLRSLRSRSGAVLKELNKQTGPMRAELPAAMKAKLAPSSDAVEMIYDQMKSAADAPVLLDKQADRQATDVTETPVEEDSQSVHLFEDVELVHHLKPTRKSYGKTKKVTFRNSFGSGSEDEAPAPANNQSSDEDDDLGDLSFHLPEVARKQATKKKRKTKKQLLSKKEKAEVDAWAACFNSMCEDIEGFDLVVE